MKKRVKKKQVKPSSKKKIMKKPVRRAVKKAAKKRVKHIKKQAKKIRQIKKIKKHAVRGIKKSQKPKKPAPKKKTARHKKPFRKLPGKPIKTPKPIRSLQARPKKIAEIKRSVPEGVPDPTKYLKEYTRQFTESYIVQYYRRMFSKSSLFLKRRRRTLWRSVTLDLMFLLIMVLLIRGSSRVFPETFAEVFSPFTFPIVFTVSLMIFLVGVLAYSVIKYRSLFLIEEMFKGNIEFSLDKIDGFYILNVLIWGIWFLALSMAAAVSSFSGIIGRILIWIVFVLLSIFTFSFINISHWLYFHNQKFRRTLVDAWTYATKGIKKYIGAVFFVYGASAIYAAFAFLIGWILKLNDFDISLYKIVVISFGIIFLYTLLVHDRICFYFIVGRMRNKTN